MLHKKEWCTCDRCGKYIEEVPERAKWKHFISPYKKIDLNVETVELDGYIGEHYLTNDKVLSAKIVEYYESKTKTLHLCPECRFESCCSEVSGSLPDSR